jgi:hypothetical protein
LDRVVAQADVKFRIAENIGQDFGEDGRRIGLVAQGQQQVILQGEGETARHFGRVPFGLQQRDEMIDGVG